MIRYSIWYNGINAWLSWVGNAKFPISPLTYRSLLCISFGTTQLVTQFDIWCSLCFHGIIGLGTASICSTCPNMQTLPLVYQTALTLSWVYFYNLLGRHISLIMIQVIDKIDRMLWEAYQSWLPTVIQFTHSIRQDHLWHDIDGKTHPITIRRS